MTEIERIPDTFHIEVEGGKITDAKLDFVKKDDRLEIYLTAEKDCPRILTMRWLNEQDHFVQVLGDDWERLQGTKGFCGLNADRALPWYFIVTDGQHTDGCGVKTAPSAFVSFSCDGEGVNGYFDVRCGGEGVKLAGRRLHVADLVCRHYDNMTAYQALKSFCKVMCDKPLMPAEPVYGGNNWYHAYGNFTPADAVEDARLQADLAKGNKVRPFMVLDDGWEINQCCGPWEPKTEFADMKALADQIKALGVRPGLWVRFLHNQKVYDEHPEYRIVYGKDDMGNLDPSREEVKQIIREDIARVKGWGYELIKHDFSTYDMFRRFDYTMAEGVTDEKRWHFYDTSKTSAEIVLDFYRTIREAAGDTLIIGCNTFSHLVAGLAEMNRIGDDTSGRHRDRTRQLGVNSLAFRLAQHGTFYAVDADVAGGFQDDTVDWWFNHDWIDLLAKSGSPFFISCRNHVLNDEQFAFIRDSYTRFLKQSDDLEPVDWLYNDHPRRWLVNGKEEIFTWQKDAVAPFLYCRTNQDY